MARQLKYRDETLILLEDYLITWDTIGKTNIYSEAGTKYIYLGYDNKDSTNSHTKYYFTTKENYDFSIKNGYDHIIDLEMTKEEVDRYFESVQERRKRIIEDILEDK